ncbi:uncharacterized protein LOC113795821 [Dermatophagoides pteronyssinus]|uniref:uncharacterized protein LOC113795821 n=1 Tax=Dermatophagoides pteronyssinus TaxID=6956 RepID=UPI003F6816C9
MLLQIKTFIYSAIKHIVEEYGTSQHNLLHYLEYCCYINWLIRALFLWLMYMDPETFPFFESDYVAAFFWNYRHILNKFYIIIGTMLALIAMLGIRTFYFHPIDTASFQVLYDCIVYNTDQYWKSMDTEDNIQRKKSERFQQYCQHFEHDHRFLSKIMNPLINLFISIRVWLDSWLELDQVDQELFEKQNHMRMFLYATIKGRSRCLFLVMIADLLTYGFHVFLAIASIPCAIIILPVIFQYNMVQNSWILKFTFIIEVLLFIHNTLLLFQCAMLLSFSMLISYQAFHSELSELNRSFLEITENSRKGIKQIGTKEFTKLKFIYKRHNILSYYLIYPDKDAWSQALYYYALLSIPINVSLLCILIIEQLTPQIRMMLILVTIVHAFTGLIPFLNTANVSNDFHRIKDYILPLQFQLKRRQHLRIKLKYDDLYGRLLNGKKISFTFGYLGDLTFRGLFEAFLSYIVAFFLILGFYMDERQNKQSTL